MIKNMLYKEDMKKINCLYKVQSIARENDVFCDFVEFLSDDPTHKDAGLYFVVCPTLDLLQSLRYNMKEFKGLLDFEKKKSDNELNCYYNIVNVSSINPSNGFSLHQKMCRAIQDTAIVKASFYEFGYDLPKTVVRTTVDNLYHFNEKRRDTSIAPELRERYNKVLKDYVSESYHTYAKMQDLPPVKTIPLTKHRVHADFFIKNHIQTSYDTVSKQFYEFLENHLDKYPEFIYYKESSPAYILRDVTENKTNWKKNHDECKFNIGFPTSQEHIFYGLMIEYNCRNYNAKIPYQTLKEHTKQLCTLQVSQNDMWNFNSLCAANHVPFAVDNGEINDITSASVAEPTIIYRVEDKNMVMGIIDRLAHEKRNYYPLTQKQKEAVSQNRPRKHVNPYFKDPGFSR